MRNYAAKGMPLLLLTLAVLGNLFPIKIFFGFDWFWGSIAVLLLIRHYSASLGALGPLASSAGAWFGGCNFIGALVHLAESFWIHLSWHRTRRNIVILDFFYWAAVATLAVIVYTSGKIQLHVQAFIFLLLKLSVNGLVNAFAAEALTVIAGYCGAESSGNLPSLQRMLSTLFIAFICLSALSLISLGGWQEFHHTESSVLKQIQITHARVSSAVEHELLRQSKTIGSLSSIIETIIEEPALIQNHLDIIRKSNPLLVQIFAADSKGRSLASSPSLDEQDHSDIGLSLADGDYYQNLLQTKKPVLSVVSALKPTEEAAVPLILFAYPLNIATEGARSPTYAAGLIDPAFAPSVLMPLACSGEMITLVDEHHGVIASTNPLIQPGTGFWETKSRDFHHQIEDSVEHFILFRRGPFLERWRHSRYILDKEITFENLSLHAPWRIIIEHSITPHVEALYDYYNSSLMGLLLLLFAAAVAALLGSYWLGKPIRILAALTQGLPEKLHQDQEILWPKARIVEQDVLLKNYQEMATAINLHIEAIDAYAARLEHSVQRDALTGLFNRTVLPERLRTAIERARNANSSFALLFIDLDRFKTVNDLHGHAAGDAVLVEVAERLTAHSSEACCVIRLGGDEFTVLLEKAAHQTVVDFIRRFFDSMERPITIAGADIVIDTSVGISIYPQDGNDAGVLLKRADSAMYRAKQETGNTYCFYESPTDD